MQYTISCDNRKNYPYALAGLARIATIEKNYKAALKLYQQADSVITDHTFMEGMGEIYKQLGETEKAKAIAAEILSRMKALSGIATKNTGQNEDHEMAHAWMGVGNYDEALDYALQEYNRRPGNIEVNETVAIVYYGRGEYAKALPFIDTALKTNCKNPELLCHAGLIYAKTGRLKDAKVFLHDALKNKPYISRNLAEEAGKTYAELAL